MTDDVDRHLPLTPLAFEILLALSLGARHGYAIMGAVEERAGGVVSLHAGTLYRALARLVDTGLIEETEEPTESDADARRRYYGITALGGRVAHAEARRLESQVSSARSFGILGGAGET